MKLFLIISCSLFLFSCKSKRDNIIGKWISIDEENKNIDSSIIYRINDTYVQEILNKNESKTRHYKYISGDTIYGLFGYDDLTKWHPLFYVVKADKKNLILQLFFGKKLGKYKVYYQRINSANLKIDPKDDVRYLFKGTNMFDMTDSLTVDSLYNAFRGV